jgi:hypothetical protein
VAAWTFHPRFVSPFYRRLMGGDLATLAPAERAALRAQFQARAAEIGEPELRAMLRAGWRPAAVAAWFIAARRERALQAEIERGLVERPSHVAPPCLCLAHLGGAAAEAALAGYADACTAAALRGVPCDESRTPEWAVCAWAHLSGAAPEARWAAFVDAEMAGLAQAGWLDGRAAFAGRLRASWDARFAAAQGALPAMLAFVDAAG